MNASELIKRIAFSKTYEFLDRNPEQNFARLIEWLREQNMDGFVARKLPIIQEFAGDPNSNWYKLALSFWNDVDDEVRKTLFTNFMINGNLLENKKLAENRRRHQCSVPWAIAMDPTPVRGTPSSEDEKCLSFDRMDDLIEQGKELGTYFYAFLGGDPLACQEDLIALCNKHAECVFLCVTGGGRVSELFARELLRIKNMIPLLVLDGFEHATDARRGQGAFSGTLRAAEILRKNRLPFGFCIDCTSENWEEVSSETFFDAMIGWGAKAAWFSPYLPTGESEDTSRMLSDGQREQLCVKLKEYWNTKPLFAMNYCSDGTLTGGCMAAGRIYCHISANGDVEPCAFLHCSDSNIFTGSLLDAYQAPLFQTFCSSQPFDANPLRPCPLLDHPEKLRDILEKAGADVQARADMGSLCGKCAQQAKQRDKKAEMPLQSMKEKKPAENQ